MSHMVNIHEAKTHLSRLLKRVRLGEEIIIAKAGKPYARLCPLVDQAERQPGLLTGRVGEAALAPLSEEELEEWYR